MKEGEGREARGGQSEEGDERGSDRESMRFFYIAKGSLAELITQLELARDIEFISDQQLHPLEDECIQIKSATC